FFTASHDVYGLIPYNIFEAWEPLIEKYHRPRPTEFIIGYEGAYKICAFGEDDACGKSIGTKGNVLQLWQKQQDGLAALKGADTLSVIGQYAQQYLHDDDNQTHALFTPNATLHMP